MYIKRYVFSALLLIGAVGWFVYAFITKESIHLEVMGIVLPQLPIAAWVALAMGLLLLATLAHMIFYSIVGSFRLRRYERDYQHLLEAVMDAFLKKQKREHAFKTQRYKLLGKIVDHTEMEPDKTLETIGNEKLALVVNTLHQIRRGESVDLKPFNLPKNNPLVQQNLLNLFKEGNLENEEILSDPDTYGEKLCKLAYARLVANAPLHPIEKYREFMSFKALETLLERINADRNTLSIPNETLLDFFRRLDGLGSLDFLYLAAIVSDNMLPEQRIKLFETLSEENDRALDAYLFTLFDLEMVDKATEILDGTRSDEYMLFKAYAELKTCNKHYDINIFVSMMLQGYNPEA